jgi:AcrR family transcriptional regulator
VAGGRPRGFDIDVALDRAMEVFWRQGYEGTRIADLTEAIGINPPSFYAAFGDKEQAFRRALDRYAEGPARYISESFALTDIRSVIESLLHGAADATTDPHHPPGCMTVQGGLAASPAAQPAIDELTRRRTSVELVLRHRLESARAEGELTGACDPAALARYIMAIYQGIAVQAASGAKRADLHQVADLALEVWSTVSRDGTAGSE